MKTRKEQGFYIIQVLQSNGYEAFFIGGSVRNGLHNLKNHDNIKVKDFDIVTNASYESVSALFEDVDTRGEQFKVAVVKINGNEFEVAQYRGESYPEGGSLRPNEVYAVQTLKEDLQRRDFTINGIAEDVQGNIIDYVDGIQDIENKVIRTIGNASERFSEDPLRILRAFRFASQLEYYIEPTTYEAILDNYDKLSIIPHERVAGEMEKLLQGKNASSALVLMSNLGATFFNSIKNKQVNLFGNLFNLDTKYFVKVMERLSKIEEKEMTYLYSALYSETEWEKAEEEMKDSMFMNNDDIKFVTLVIKHKNLAVKQNEKKLLELLEDLTGKFENRETLNKIIQHIELVYGTKINLTNILTRPLFKNELAFTGEDVIKVGKEIGIDKPGKWVSQVIKAARAFSVLEIQYELENVITYIKRREEMFT